MKLRKSKVFINSLLEQRENVLYLDNANMSALLINKIINEVIYGMFIKCRTKT